MTAVAFALKYWWAAALALLLVAFLWERGETVQAKADLTTAQARVADLTTANKAATDALSQMRAVQVDNDKIADEVALRLKANLSTETQAKADIVKVVSNDPVARAWSDEPVPSGVRDALHAH